MKTKHYEPFFNLSESNLDSTITFGFSHFFNRAKTYTSWDSYSTIIPDNEKGGGKLLLGQLPIDDFHKAIVNEIQENGLIVSCNDCFELSGVGTLFQVIAPHNWFKDKIFHHHLPFTDFSDNAAPFLIIEALEKMRYFHARNKNIYVHCKAGRARSGLIVALFLCISDETIKNQLLQTTNSAEIQQILLNVIYHLKQLRPQVSVGSHKLALGVKVLTNYLDHWRNEDYKKELFNPFNQPKSPQTYLAEVSQSDLYKFLWAHAYQNPQDFALIARLAKDLYETVSMSLEYPERFFSDYLQKLPAVDRQKIKNICQIFKKSSQLIGYSRIYSHPFNHLILSFNDLVLKSNLLIPEKINLLNSTNDLIQFKDLSKYKELKNKLTSREVNNEEKFFIALSVGLALLVLSVTLLTIFVSLLVMGIVIGLALLATIGIACSLLFKKQSDSLRLSTDPYQAALELIDTLEPLRNQTRDLLIDEELSSLELN